MKLGIHVRSDRHLEDVIGLTKAALSKGHEVIIFTMADGVKLLENLAFTELCKLKGVFMSFCDYNVTGYGVNKTIIPEEVICGSQFNNANMVSEADKVLVL